MNPLSSSAVLSCSSTLCVLGEVWELTMAYRFSGLGESDCNSQSGAFVVLVSVESRPGLSRSTFELSDAVQAPAGPGGRGHSEQGRVQMSVGKAAL